MTTKTVTVSARLNPKVKSRALKVLNRLGITTSQAVTMFFNQISEEQGLPFRPHIPNAETERVIQEAMEGKNLKSFDTLEDLLRDLDLPDA